MEPDPPVSRGFAGRRATGDAASRLPPGQYLEDGFPVLSAGPTPIVAVHLWDLQVRGKVARPQRWGWEAFRALPRERVTADVHCVTRWSKLDTRWAGVPVDALLAEAGPIAATHVVAHCDGGYTTNLPLEDVTGGRAWVADTYEGAPLPAVHGGPARLLVPHLYFWKSAKWVRALVLTDHDEPGFWERAGYHHYGDPWKEQRFDIG